MVEMLKEVNIRRILIKLTSVILIGGFLLSLTGCYFLPKKEEVLAPPLKQPEKVSYQTVEVKRGTVEQKSSCYGYFVSPARTNLAFKFKGGYLKTFNVKTGIDVRTNHNDLKKVNNQDPTRGDQKQDILVKAGDVIAELETGDLAVQIEQQETSLKIAQLTCEELKTDQEIQGGGNKFTLEKAELEAHLAQLRLDDLKLQMEQSKLVSPVSGVVDFIGDVMVGEYVDANETLVRVIDPNKLVLEATDAQTAGLKLGMKVDVEIKDKTYKGDVVIGPYDVSARDYERANESGGQRFAQLFDKLQKTIRVNVQDMPEDVTIGDSAKISAVLAKRENVLMLPTDVINQFEGSKYVKVLKNGAVFEQDVELGIASATDYEIISGVQEGDKVVR
jgi:macrolide-specific efflux system membrane fusion protein